ncbi:PREDICTED: interleukin-11 isoform X1 [Hipposideros armiger]|uniref:Interleukin-11 isoform X1 n=1 Tax=Hipposideros armiger TaxID=186990 RepID=A0A8B7Q3X4_HIPAR|nr:PREDICTED: interleukin-11 isoform X1 [Hipposideros armiger]
MSAGALGALQVRAGEMDGGEGGSWAVEGVLGGWGATVGMCYVLLKLLMPCPQLPGVLTRLRADLFSYLRHVQWLRRVGGPSLRTLEPELGGLQARLDRLLRRLQLLMSRLALPQAPPDPPAPPLAPPASAWGGIRAAHAILGGLHLTLDWAVRGLLLLKTRL